MGTTQHPTAYPEPFATHYDRPVWVLGLDPDDPDGLMVAGHDRRAHAALHAEARARDSWRVHWSRVCQDTDTSPDPELVTRNRHPLAGYEITARWARFHTHCGHTETEHAAHEDSGQDLSDDGCGCAHEGLPPCADPYAESTYAWLAEYVDQDAVGALPVLVAHPIPRYWQPRRLITAGHQGRTGGAA